MSNTDQHPANVLNLDALLDAVTVMAHCLGDGMTASMVGGGFTCIEAESIADVLRKAGHDDAAAVWIEGHAEGDDDPEDMHYQAPDPLNPDTCQAVTGLREKYQCGAPQHDGGMCKTHQHLRTDGE